MPEIAVLSDALPDDARAEFERHLGDRVAFLDATDPKLLDAPVIFGSPPPEVVAASSALRWLLLDSTGTEKYDALDWETLGRRVRLTTMHGLFARPVSESVIAGLLALSRRLPDLVRAQDRRSWIKDQVREQASLLCERPCLVLGAGSLGGAIAGGLRGLGCTVTTWGRTGARADLAGDEALERALPAASVIVAALPATPETDGLLDARRLDLLPAGALLASIGRSSVLDEAALIARLDDGRFCGAVLDVTGSEPLEPDDPLWSAPNCLLTQHTGGGWTGEGLAKMRMFLSRLEQQADSS